MTAPVPAAPKGYTPTDEDLRRAWIYYTNRDEKRWRQRGEGNAEIDRWLTAHDSQVRDAALTEAAAAVHRMDNDWDGFTPSDMIGAAESAIDSLREGDKTND